MWKTVTWQRAAASVLRRADCSPVTGYGLVMDIDEQKKAADIIDEALTQARLANVAKTSFLARMSHDIRTPMNGILGIIEINQAHAEDTEFTSRNREKAKVAANYLLSTKIPFIRPLFFKIFPWLIDSIFNEAAGFKTTEFESNNKHYRIDVLQCPYRKYCELLGCKELTATFCLSDDRIYGNMSGITFDRQGTIGRGSDKCDFYFYREN